MPMDFEIVTDSSSNLVEEMIDDFGLHVLPLTFMVDGEEYQSYLKGQHTDLKQCYTMMREGKGAPLKRVSWDTALDFVASKLSAIKEKYGPDSIFVTGSSRGAGNEANLAAQRFARACIGTNNIDNCART